MRAGHDVKEKTLTAVARVLGKSLDELVDNTPAPATPAAA